MLSVKTHAFVSIPTCTSSKLATAIAKMSRTLGHWELRVNGKDMPVGKSSKYR